MVQPPSSGSLGKACLVKACCTKTERLKALWRG